MPGLGAGQIYAYRAHGPFAPERGLRFDPEKVLLDPYGLAVAVPDGYDRAAASRPGDNAAVAMKSVVADPGRYDWEGDAPLRRPFAETIIYELHVRGFTRHPSSGVAPAKRGTYAGLIEKIPYLKDLGVTAVELLPVFQFDPQDAPPGRVELLGLPAGLVLRAASRLQLAARTPLGVLDEFRDMVKALHRAGIEVILDVVFNHTAEGGADGPTLCYRGLRQRRLLHPRGGQVALRRLHRLRQHAQRQPADRAPADPGQPALLGHRDARRRLPLRPRVDPVARRDGQPLPNPPVLWDIESDPLLAGTKLIAEAWDAAGLYQVGQLRRRHLAGMERPVPRRRAALREGRRRHRCRALAARLLGSPDLYGHEEREAEQSINFVTCHDGFTLNDLVSYNQKHNEANGEDNRDGAERQPELELRRRRARPTIRRSRRCATARSRTSSRSTLLAAGTPMLLMGDEVRRTQAATTTPTARTTRSAGSTGACSSGTRDIHRFVKALERFPPAPRRGRRRRGAHASTSCCAGRASSGTAWS